MKKKNNKKNKKKFLLKKIFRGFTLVELLAVIVILAIIMIIAIPSVISTMKTAKNKSMINFAQKVLNQTEKVYLEKSNFGGLPRPSQTTTYVFDIRKDLGFTNSGSYFGISDITLYDDNSYTLGITMSDDENYLVFTTYHSEGTPAPVLGLDYIFSNRNYKSMLPDDLKFEDFPLKYTEVATQLSTKKNWDYHSYIDMSTLTQMYCTNPEHASQTWDHENQKYKIDEDMETLRYQVIQKYIETRDVNTLINCPIE